MGLSDWLLVRASDAKVDLRKQTSIRYWASKHLDFLSDHNYLISMCLILTELTNAYDAQEIENKDDRSEGDYEHEVTADVQRDTPSNERDPVNHRDIQSTNINDSQIFETSRQVLDQLNLSPINQTTSFKYIPVYKRLRSEFLSAACERIENRPSGSERTAV
ncbi:hypothetical protein FQA39_LY09990 [Lamprigera yunnana]|nr:hypothetical protein FQA39_LY09990 [Lamprigera yunnana]